MSKRVRLTPRLGIPIVLVLVLLTALVASTLAQAASLHHPSTQGNIYNYVVKVEEQNAKVCVGQTIDFIVTVTLDLTFFDSAGVGHSVPVYYTGERVVPSITGSQIGTISPAASSTSHRLGGDPLAPIQIPRGQGRILTSRQSLYSLPLVFTFSAEETGTTTIEFAHTERAFRGAPVSTHTAVANVEVTDCWEAYATGLWTGNAANNWTKKDICSLERPFVLDGNGKAVVPMGQADFRSRAFFFWPFQNPFAVAGLTALQDGRYVMVGGSTITGQGMEVHCTLIGSGSYQQFLFGNRTPREGNFILNGSSVNYCEGTTIAVAREVIEVAFRALGAGQTCQESLP